MPPTIQNVLDTILAAVTVDPLSDTVDVIKTGDPSQEVTGIVTTFLATIQVIEQTALLGANLIIAHEPVFYNHLDQTDWLTRDTVYTAKRRLLDEHHIVVWRFHDYWHMHQPDGILTGVLLQLGWQTYLDPDKPYLCNIPPVTLRNLALMLKEKFYAAQIRLIGNPDMVCWHVALLPGQAGGASQIEMIGQPGVDVLVCGEVAEWETTEYARDAMHMGLAKALIVVGHANSEESGMLYLVDWLNPLLPGIPITHIPANDPFSWL